jgi:DNA-directed RNA polymerase subunit F
LGNINTGEEKMEKILGFLSVLLGFLAVWEAKRTDELIKAEDERVKNMIAEMDKRHQETMRYLQQSLDFLGSLIKIEGQQAKELINKVLDKIPG